MIVAGRKLLRALLALGDSATIGASFVGAFFTVRFLFHPDFISLARYVWLLGPIVPIWLVCLRIFGFYGSAAYASRGTLVSRLVQTHFIAGLLLFSAMYLMRAEAVSRLLLHTFLTVSVALFTLQKLALRAYLDPTRRSTRDRRRRILLVSTPASAERYLHQIRAHVSMTADVIGLLAPDASCCHACPSHLPPMLGAAEDLPLVLRTHVVDELIVALLPDQTVLERLSRWCAVRGVVMNVLVEMPSPAIGVWNAEHFGEGTFLFSLKTIRHEALDLLAKRVVDLLGAAIGLLVCGVAYVWYGMRLHRETGDSVLFRQRRVGENGRRFMLYKFRTMYSGSEQCKTELDGRNEMSGPIFKLRDDPRVTRTGRRLRRRHLDELPQFWNALKGEMSLVGARPPTENEAAVYSDHHQRRLSIKPGLTGLWQLSGNGAVKDFEEVVKLDCEYIDNWSLWLDFKIVARTIAKVVRGNAW